MTNQTVEDSELRYRRLFESAQDGILILDANTGMIEDVNPFLVKMLGYTRQEFIKKRLWEVGAFRDIEASKDAFKELQEKDYIRYEDMPLKTKDGRFVQVEFVSNVYKVHADRVIQCNIRDITDRKHAEAQIQEKEYILSQSQLHAHIGSWGWDLVGLIKWTDETYRIYGISPEEVILTMDTLINLVHPDDRQSMQKWIEACGLGNDPENLEFRTILPNGSIRFINGSGHLLFDKAGKPVYMTGTVQDITERKFSEQKIQRQLEHLTALSAIDRLISSSFDLKANLAEILTHVSKELKIDAATILLFNPNSLMLEYGADFGFRFDGAKKSQIRIGESYAGLAALKRQLVQIPNLKADPGNELPATLFTGEDFACYYGVPLIAKGQVKGVLEVFNRTALQPDGEWLDFLNSLARQTAIAIDNATLFEGLQRSNLELQLAYDATIEGWSHALDMRDKETKGHSSRVTDMTLKLAHSFNLTEIELVNIRRGALLHDIGKMGISDSVLLNPGPLTDLEWVEMKKHPTNAFEMLSPIAYLRQATDIPYCHHEKWDGSGYPQGLQGLHIPLAARIFAIVDVWDALNSDRPYRPAWSIEKIYEHIENSSGTHFDPQVVDLFMSMIRE